VAGTEGGDAQWQRLTAAQRAAHEHVARVGAARLPEARGRLDARMGREARASLVASVAASARVTLSFHPDRLLGPTPGGTVASSMGRDLRYRSQFETGISNGSVSAFSGGEREVWERELFGGAYQDAGSGTGERPKYGALNLMDHSDGAAPRFGSCYLRLRPEVLTRCTLTFGDSHLAPTQRATASSVEVMFEALMDQADATGHALGLPCEDGLCGLALVRQRCARPRDPGLGPNARSLDDYIEVQVHGDIRLDRDAEAIVADPSFRGTETGRALAALAARAEVELAYHPGFSMGPGEVPDGFRGPEIARLAEFVCERLGEPVLHAELVGRACASLTSTPEHWTAWGSRTEALQRVKKLWHVLVHLGRPLADDHHHHA
jgi:hypothetical protein